MYLYCMVTRLDLSVLTDSQITASVHHGTSHMKGMDGVEATARVGSQLFSFVASFRILRNQRCPDLDLSTF